MNWRTTVDQSSTYIQTESIYVVGVGAQTVVGRSVFAAAAAVRAGISRYAEHPFMLDRYLEPMVVARARWLSDSLRVEERVISLAVDAARESLIPLETLSCGIPENLGIHLALSEENFPDPSSRWRICDQFVQRIGGAVNRNHLMELVVDGHAGGLQALANACDRLRRAQASFCLVGGVDSWLDPERLQALDHADRLHTTRHSWGITPGEGAGFCLLTIGSNVRRLGLYPYCEVQGVATAQEIAPMSGEAVCTGQGLTAAFRGVLGLPARVAHSYCDFNGETYRADEYGFTMSRTSERFEHPARVTAAAASWGDVGAASGLLSLVLPIAAWSGGYAAGDLILVWGSSAHTALRAAALLRRPSTSTKS